ncbi:MAG: aldose epimerase, partial [Opitutales bacterium]|nr:aldose epimerase [Opitutales bacterium]
MEKFTVANVPMERWTVGASTYETCLTRGARLIHWKLDLPTGVRNILHWPEGADFAQDKIGLVRGGNPILFPFMGRNYADGEKFFWKDSAGVKRPMPQHGFARDCEFEFIESSDKHALLRLIPNARAEACYPFKYEFRVRYEFRELFVRCTFEFENRDQQPLPWCAGHHFYFTLPWHKGLNRS